MYVPQALYPSFQLITLADFVFTPQDNSESASSHITDLSLSGSVGSALMNAGMGLNGNFIIGEWSCALSDDSLSVEEDPISSRKLFCDVQEQTYRDVSSGSTFWSKQFQATSDLALQL